MQTKRKLTLAQHKLLLQVMRIELEETTWTQAMESGRAMYKELIKIKSTKNTGHGAHPRS